MRSSTTPESYALANKYHSCLGYSLAKFGGKASLRKAAHPRV
jgi:hypothetical protein